MMSPTPEPMVNHQADSPTVAASCAVPTVAPPPTHVPAMPPADAEALCRVDRPRRPDAEAEDDGNRRADDDELKQRNVHEKNTLQKKKSPRSYEPGH